MKKSIILSMALMSALMVSAGSLDKGVDRNNLDLTTTPGTDFYQYACGGWMKAHPLDPQYARFGTFDQMAESSREQLKELVLNLSKQQNAKGTMAQKVGDIFNMGMDSTRLNSEGAKPLMKDIDFVKGVKKATLPEMVAFMHMGIASPFFDSGVMADLKNSDVNLMYIQQSGMGLGDRDYYLDEDANTKKVRAAYLTYANKLFTFIGYKKNDAKKAAETVLKIEKELAKAAMTREEQRDYSKQYNIFTLEELQAKYPNFNWKSYFSGLGLNNVNRVCVSQLDFMKKVDELISTLKEKEIKEYLIFKYMDAAAPYLSDAFNEANFDVYSRALSGKQVMQPRWKRSLNVPNTLLGEGVGQLYVEKYFPAESKKKMKQLNKLQSIIMLVGACFMVVGAGLYVFGEQTIAPLSFAPGTIMFAAMQYMQQYTGTDITIRRLRRIMLTGAALFVLSALFMVENSYHIIYPLFLKSGIEGYNYYIKYIHNNWVVLLLAAAVLQLYSTHRISSELGKSQG